MGQEEQKTLTLTHFIIFLAITLFLTFKDPYWGLLCYFASLFFSFQDYLPELTGFPIHALLLLLIFFTALFQGKFQHIRIDTKFKIICLYLFTIILSAIIVNGYYPEKSRQLFGYVLYVYLMIAFIKDRQALIQFISVYYAMIIFLCIMLLHSWYVGDNYYYYWHNGQPFGQNFLEHPNVITFHLVWGIVMSLFFFFHYPQKYLKIIFACIAPLLTFGITLCASRSGTLALILACFLVFIFLNNHKQRILLVFLTLVIASLVLQRAEGKFWNRMGYITGIDKETGEYEGSAQERLDSWGRGYKIFKDHPLFGVGMFNIVKYNFRVNFDGTLEGRAIHGGYIEMFAENGIAGGSLWLALVFLSIRDLFGFRKLNKIKSRNYEEIIMVNKIFLCCLGTYLFHSITGSVQYSYFIFTVWGISSATRNVAYYEKERMKIES